MKLHHRVSYTDPLSESRTKLILQTPRPRIAQSYPGTWFFSSPRDGTVVALHSSILFFSMPAAVGASGLTLLGGGEEDRAVDR